MATKQQIRILIFVLCMLQFFCTPTILAIADYTAADFIIFSYNRPMQLYAVLESTEHYVTGLASISVIYRSSDERYEQCYQIVRQQFPYVQFIKQGSQPKKDFQPLTLQAIKAGTSPYVLFAPDDIIVKNYVDLHLCIQKLEEYGAYGFYLRLGTHLKYCYAESKILPLPQITPIENLCQWTFKHGIGDWGYPNNVDMTIYRKNDILWQLEGTTYTSPNTMEGHWAGLYQKHAANKTGLCFRDSVVVNIPVNLTQEDWVNPYMHSWTTLQLLELFQAGKKIDISPISGIKNKSCHINFDLTFIDR